MIIYIAIRHGIPLVFCPCQKRLRSPIFRLQSINRFPTQIFEWKKKLNHRHRCLLSYIQFFHWRSIKKRVAVKRHYVILSVSYCNGNQVKKYHQKRENFSRVYRFSTQNCSTITFSLCKYSTGVYYRLSRFFL